ncbi:MAG: hypothetical protein M1829_000855 [Trizodia sp. TS-e1964]|nr:MAG: hypothetical protein M1829_000855 [Trizodia sp. TS-e1964]
MDPSTGFNTALPNGGGQLHNGESQLAVVPRARKKLVLCFDGTGNKFKGNEGDSNILKIFRMLDRTSGDEFHYYQPGIGTYITSSSLSHTSLAARVRSWYLKAKDSAVGISFDHHVIGGYKFLMKYYSPGDDIYFFGFSRGAYTARFLAEMLDYVGLLTHGNEEMVFFAWKTFSRWQERHGGDAEHKEKKMELFRFMKAFRETFTRPVRRIRFLGLFDTVNSVPRFEAAWMQRSKFPYTARSSAKVIRHAVALDERRAKFRSDLISQKRHTAANERSGHHFHHAEPHRPRRSSKVAEIDGHLAAPTGRGNSKVSDKYQGLGPSEEDESYLDIEQEEISMRYRSRSRSRGRSPMSRSHSSQDRQPLPNGKAGEMLSAAVDFATHSSGPATAAAEKDNVSLHSTNPSHFSLALLENELDADSDDGEQDVEELWFPGGHADIGGGWDLGEGEATLSHPPLVWMVREAQRAGLAFDEEKMRDMECWDPEDDISALASNREPYQQPRLNMRIIPEIQVSSSADRPSTPTHPETTAMDKESGKEANTEETIASFRSTLRISCTKGRIHDCLAFNNGLSAGSVISWRMMEYLPFRRMDLQPDGSWKPIRWPLPRGEVRDVPDDVRIHGSVLRRMLADENYRPGNLIVGGGGRGVRRAPKEMGIGEWVVVKEEGSEVGEVLMKKSVVENGTV